jgi:hypothetical protein
MAATEALTKRTSWRWDLTACDVACEGIWAIPVTIGATASTLARASTRPAYGNRLRLFRVDTGGWPGSEQPSAHVLAVMTPLHS